jgi:hypothetical protein
MFMRTALSIVGLSLIGAVTGCSARVLSLHRDETNAELRNMVVVAEAWNKDRNRRELFSMKQFLESAVHNGHITSGEATSLKSDGWGNDYVAEFKYSEHRITVVRIVSAGLNGEYEDGFGDDLAVEMRFESTQSPQIRFLP